MCKRLLGTWLCPWHNDDCDTQSRGATQLKEDPGAEKAVALELTTRWAPFGIAQKPQFVEKRRRELEGWLWQLIADPGIARSRPLNQFLELSDAARMITRQVLFLDTAPSLRAHLPDATCASLV